MVTAGVSAYVASHGQVGLVAMLHLILGTGLATAGALALNQYVERDYDALMVRTRSRPHPLGPAAPEPGAGSSAWRS